MLLCIVYFPPSSTHNTYTEFFDSFAGFGSYDNIFVCGDFNLCINNNLDIDYFLNSNTKVLYNFLQLYNLIQCNNVPNCYGRYLDLVLSGINFCKVNVSQSENPLVSEDAYHPALSIVAHFEPTRKKKCTFERVQYDFKRADFLTLWSLLTMIDWNFLNTFDDVNNAVTCFHHFLNEALAKTIPLKTIGNKFPFWYSRKTKSLIKRKGKVRRQAFKYKDPNSLALFGSLRSDLKK